ncbi:unnamed protein product [Orchesella dallaii]|uniref:Death domain-containing protein n=1 Tax=Orchesella dallaii TaxID=48710 RepID=A0ABP1RPI0_9HEXA
MDGLQVGSKECSFVDICDTLGKCSSAAILYEKWKELARQLNLPPVVILRLEKRLSADIIDEPEAIYQIIYNWRSISSYEATLHKLIGVFEHIKLRDAADELRQAFGLGVITKRVRPQKYIHGPEQLCNFLSSDKIVLILSTLDSKITCDRIQDTSKTPLTFFPCENSLNKASNLHHASDNVNVCVTSNCASIISQLLKLTKKTVLVTEENINDLLKDFKNEKNIYFSTDIIKWSELSQTFQQQILQRCELLNKVESLESFINGRLLVDLINDPFQVKLKDSLPPKLLYYIPRRLKTRFLISPEIFTERGSNDIYLFTGLERFELTAFAQENPTDTSRNQLAQRNISSRFILLEMKRDFEKICSKTKHGVHWLHYDEGQFTLLKSKGNLSSLQDHVDKHQKEFTEDDFLSHINSQSIIDKSLAPVCISDSPGMGKSILLANIGRKLKETGQSVIFVVIEEFITKLKTALQENNVMDAMIRVLGSITFGHENNSKLSTALLKLLLLSGEGKKFELLFDGLDELNPKDFELAYKCLKLMAKTFKSGRLWVTTRLHLLAELENNLEVLGYNITPFDEEDQVNFFVSYWSQ